MIGPGATGSRAPGPLAGLSDAEADETGGNALMPLVDVVFMLVVFLLLTANAVSYALKVDTPEAAGAQAHEARETVVLTAPHGGRGWQVDGAAHATAQAARRAVAQALDARPDAVLVVAAAADSSAQDLIDALEMARQAGARSVDVAARPHGPAAAPGQSARQGAQP
ncbi:hypothetical protein CCR85_07195 [Rhodothalassium salexigens]|uniref:ExbD/TolR family protein n=1 Tax=Rhodothalassium salexigens TaxID=1086 RepID=UPI0019121B48|nr:biopolymer transporter ExbD [Rhodothalassium salexigens]MBK5911277.1 hypothetical protein [Rhodothalassium salexigens]MBK5919685.1 hypothetical protein [Rhodothalassium salexigens]